MPWATPLYSRNLVDQAGDTLIDPQASDEDKIGALNIINNWRSSHSYPLQSLKMTLLNRAKIVYKSPLVAQRIKRLSSIESKLERFRDMKLSRMQDIGGCRAVVPTVEHVFRLARSYEEARAKNPHRGSQFAGSKDYISQPKPDGYRSVHLVFRYRTDSVKRSVYNGLRIEIQLRSEPQHAWATAVEVVGTFTRQALKSSQGQAEWLRFFSLMSTAIALQENTPPVPGTPTEERSLREEFEKYADQLQVEERLRTYATVAKIRPHSKAKYFLLNLDLNARQVNITSYEKKELERASEEYLKAEREAEGGNSDVVLVAVDSLAALKRAYPNYFLDTSRFLHIIRQALGRPNQINSSATTP